MRSINVYNKDRRMRKQMNYVGFGLKEINTRCVERYRIIDDEGYEYGTVLVSFYRVEKDWIGGKPNVWP